MKLKQTISIVNQIIELAEKEGWSEEELAKAVRLLHSELENYSFSVSSSDEIVL